ncbi:hypothetical protein WN944_021622 [Citrus x changshan-huyou]|uniref:Uncharacterized protein n=1 Tax=Citrus x changshan-huyou TaxID=2935761 RepID=A0AAP0MZI7_9ROSI
MRHREGESTIRGTMRENRRSEHRVVWENWLDRRFHWGQMPGIPGAFGIEVGQL